MRNCLRSGGKWLACVVLSTVAQVGAWAAQSAAEDVVVFDVPVSAADHRRDYANAVLRMVMERTVAEFGPYRIDYAPAHMERPRLFEALKSGAWVNVTAYPGNLDWMRALRAVLVPIDMGLQSWRVALIDGKRQNELRVASESGQLKRLKVGGGTAWVSVAALEGNGYPVVTGSSYTGLFDMLMAGRFDYLPRGLNEIFDEYDNYRRNYPGLAVESSLLLHDQIPSLFFVAPQEERLHRRITAGMEAMVRDGSLERLLLAHYQSALQRARLCERKRIELPGPVLDAGMSARRELWFDPFDPRHNLCPVKPLRRSR